MACNCGSKARKVDYQARFKDGTTQTFATLTAAQTAIREKRGGTIRAVKAQP